MLLYWYTVQASIEIFIAQLEDFIQNCKEAMDLFMFNNTCNTVTRTNDENIWFSLGVSPKTHRVMSQEQIYIS